MKTFKDFIAHQRTILEKKDDPCWDGYEMVGTKKKSGKDVPNCVKEDDSEVDVFLDESTQESYILELNEETLEERKIVIRVTSRGERIKRIKCPSGRIVKNVNGRKVCVTPTGKQRLTKKLAVRRTTRTKNAKGQGYKKRINFKRQKAMRKRKGMFGAKK